MNKTAKITFKEFTKHFAGDKDLEIGCHLAFKQWAKINYIEYDQYTTSVDEPYYEFDDPMDLVKLKLELNREFVSNWWQSYVNGNDGLDILREFDEKEKA